MVGVPHRELQRETGGNRNRQKEDRSVEDVDELSHLPAPVWLTKDYLPRFERPLRAMFRIRSASRSPLPSTGPTSPSTGEASEAWRQRRLAQLGGGATHARDPTYPRGFRPCDSLA